MCTCACVRVCDACSACGCMCACVFACVGVCACEWMCVHVCVYVCVMRVVRVGVCVRVFAWVCVCVCMRVDGCVYMCVHACVRVCVCHITSRHCTFSSRFAGSARWSRLRTSLTFLPFSLTSTRWARRRSHAWGTDTQVDISLCGQDLLTVTEPITWLCVTNAEAEILFVNDVLLQNINSNYHFLNDINQGTKVNDKRIVLLLCLLRLVPWRTPSTRHSFMLETDLRDTSGFHVQQYLLLNNNYYYIYIYIYIVVYMHVQILVKMGRYIKTKQKHSKYRPTYEILKYIIKHLLHYLL